jgi:hypothetical protein
MNGVKSSIIHERSNIIPIKKISSTEDMTAFSTTYSLKQNLFDPSKASPPNGFMLKLHQRMRVYDNDVKVVN